MESRQLGRTGRQVSVVGLGCWQLGADWGDVGEDDALAVLHAALDAGVTFLDTADVYGDGRSETAGRPGAARARRPTASPSPPRWAAAPTRTCRRRSPLEAFRGWLDRSRAQPRRRHDRPGPAALPADTGLLRRPGLRRPRHPRRRGGDRRVRRLRRDRRRGAHRDRPARTSRRCRSSSTRSAASRSSGCCRPPQAAGVGIIARVPLASGLLSGKYDESTTFAADDHRTYNRARRGVRRRRDVQRRAVRGRRPGRPRGRRPRRPDGATTAQLALRWIVDQPGVSTVIPGARNAEQAVANAAAADLAPLDDATLDALRAGLRRATSGSTCTPAGEGSAHGTLRSQPVQQRRADRRPRAEHQQEGRLAQRALGGRTSQHRSPAGAHGQPARRGEGERRGVGPSKRQRHFAVRARHSRHRVRRARRRPARGRRRPR